jgi:putative membrane protein
MANAQREQDLPDATSLAVRRTQLAFERTMMAWVRTAISLIAFGFSFYKFFQFEANVRGLPDTLVGPREFALAMISLGIFGLIIATVQQRVSLLSLRAQHPGVHIPFSLAGITAGLIVLLGIVALLAVIFRQ